jgi:NADH/NAD ratio-sensing transcriptional regulator Rex
MYLVYLLVPGKRGLGYRNPEALLHLLRSCLNSVDDIKPAIVGLFLLSQQLIVPIGKEWPGCLMSGQLSNRGIDQI